MSFAKGAEMEAAEVSNPYLTSSECLFYTITVKNLNPRYPHVYTCIVLINNTYIPSFSSFYYLISFRLRKKSDYIFVRFYRSTQRAILEIVSHFTAFGPK